jgi:tRNA(fMet)-specific endonuclease VapC
LPEKFYGKKVEVIILEVEEELAINEKFCNVFIKHYRTFVLSHRPGIADMLIATTVLYYNRPLYTHNKKHFQFIPDIKLI